MSEKYPSRFNSRNSRRSRGFDDEWSDDKPSRGGDGRHRDDGSVYQASEPQASEWDFFANDPELHKEIDSAEVLNHQVAISDAREIIFPDVPAEEVQSDLPSSSATPVHTGPKLDATNAYRRANKSRVVKQKGARSAVSPQANEPDSVAVTGANYAPGFSADTDWSVHIYDAKPYMDALAGVQDNLDANNAENATPTPDDGVAPHAQGDHTVDTTSVTPAEEQGAAAASGDADIKPKKKKNSKKVDKVKKSQQVSLGDMPVTYGEDGDAARARVQRNVERHQEMVEKYNESSYGMLAERSRGRLFEADGRVLRSAIKAEDLARSALAKLTKGRFQNSKEGFFRKRNTAIHEADDKLADTLHMLDRFTMALDNSQMQQWALEGKSDEEIASQLAELQQNRAEQRAAQQRAELTGGRVNYWMDKYANLPTKKKVLFGLGVSAAFVATGGALALAGGAATVVGAAGLATVKVGKTYLQSRSKLMKAGSDSEFPVVDTTAAQNDGNGRTSARDQVIVARDYTQVERAKAIKNADRNKKIAAGLATVAAIPLVGGVVHKFVDFGGDLVNIVSDHAPSGIQHPGGILDNQGGGSGANHVDKLGSGETYHHPSGNIEAPAPSAAEVAHTEFMNSSANVIPDGGGGEAFMSAHGISPSVWYNNQAEFLAKFPGEAYQMSDGNVGFAQPGGLSKAAVEFWAAKAGR